MIGSSRVGQGREERTGQGKASNVRAVFEHLVYYGIKRYFLVFSRNSGGFIGPTSHISPSPTCD